MRTWTSTRSPMAGVGTDSGNHSNDTWACGGSANHKRFPSMRNGDNARPSASRAPVPAVDRTLAKGPCRRRRGEGDTVRRATGDDE